MLWKLTTYWHAPAHLHITYGDVLLEWVIHISASSLDMGKEHGLCYLIFGWPLYFLCRKDPGFIRMNVHDPQNMKDDVSIILFPFSLF